MPGAKRGVSRSPVLWPGRFAGKLAVPPAPGAASRRTSPAAALRVLSAAGLLLALTGCGNGGSGGTASPPAASPPAAGGATRVDIKDFAFDPASLSVKPGTKVTVTNSDPTTHTLTANGKAFDTGDIAAGRTATFTAPAKTGSYPYHCMIHPFMKGTLTVG